jgi:hypothetical protein
VLRVKHKLEHGLHISWPEFQEQYLSNEECLAESCEVVAIPAAKILYFLLLVHCFLVNVNTRVLLQRFTSVPTVHDRACLSKARENIVTDSFDSLVQIVQSQNYNLSGFIQMQLFISLISGVNPNYNVQVQMPPLWLWSCNTVYKRTTVLCKFTYDAQNLDGYLVVF